MVPGSARNWIAVIAVQQTTCDVIAPSQPTSNAKGSAADQNSAFITDSIAAKIRATVACLAKPNHLGRLGVALALCCALVTNSVAQDLGFPNPPKTAHLDDKPFVDRARIVIHTNARARDDRHRRIH